MDAQQMNVIFGMFGLLLGLALFVIGLIALIVKAIAKKRKKGALILMLAALALAVGGAVFYGRSMSGYKAETLIGYDAQRVAAAVKNEDGSCSVILPEFSYTDGDGNVFNNDSLKAYDYTLINWWEPWCAHCKAELPALIEISESYADRGVNVVGIYSTEEDAEAVIEEYGISFPTVLIDLGKGGAFDILYTGGVPVSVLVDSEGRLVPMYMLTVNGKTGLDSLELLAAYDCIVPGERSFEFWQEKLDALLG